MCMKHVLSWIGCWALSGTTGFRANIALQAMFVPSVTTVAKDPCGV
jgi:hypothetical protein